MLAGVNWAINVIQKNKRQAKSVINASLESGFSQTMIDLVEKASKDNGIFAVGAGNNFDDASKYSPASAKSAITVSAIQYSWRKLCKLRRGG